MGQDSISVRPADDEDDLDELNVGNPCWVGAAMMRLLFAATAGAPTGSLVVEVDGESVGYGSYAALPVADGYRAPAGVYVLPSERGRGAGGALWAAVLEMCTPERVHGVMVMSDADDAQTVSIAVAHGFQLGGVHIESQLDLVGADLSRIGQRATAPPGLTIACLPPDADERIWHNFAAVLDRVDRDTPDKAAGAEPTPYAVLRAVLAEPWQVMGAWSGNEMVGFTSVFVRDLTARVLNTQLTGVLPEFRGMGTATALKAAHAVQLGRAGWRAITTQNMDGNAPILASNKTLGFRQLRRLRDLTFDHPEVGAAPR